MFSVIAVPPTFLTSKPAALPAHGEGMRPDGIFMVRISRKRERVWRAGRGAEDRATGRQAPGLRTSRPRRLVPLPLPAPLQLQPRTEPPRCDIVAHRTATM